MKYTKGGSIKIELKSDLGGIETVIFVDLSHTLDVLKSDLGGIETCNS